MDISILINENEAQQLVTSIEEPVTRNLVLFAIAEARRRTIRWVDQDESDYRRGLPSQPFDMEFFASVLTSLFEKSDIVRRVLDGQTLAQASEWESPPGE